MISRLSYDWTPKELAERHAGTTEVALLWSKRTHRAAVAVLDEGTGDYFELEIGENDDPLDVFNHPYAYAASRGSIPTEDKQPATA